MRILINGSNLGPGGARQVADSICRGLNKFHTDSFVVVLPSEMSHTIKEISNFENVTIYQYSLKNTWKSYLFGRDAYLDNLLDSENIDMVFSVFAPTWWTPKRPHLCGFALAHLVMSDSPFYKKLSLKSLIKVKLNNYILTYFYRRSSRYYYTENEIVTKRIKKLLHCKDAFTVSNYYNQIFDEPLKQEYHKLPDFDGITLLTISNFYPHKNLEITIGIAEILYNHHPEIKLRFVITIDEDKFPPLPDYLKEYFLFIGSVKISECPSLYEQCTFEFQPTLLECFTATYPEAMRMGRPIITTDLEFSKGICGDAALYYEALSPMDAYRKIIYLHETPQLQQNLVIRGFEQLKTLDSYEDRVEKIINLCKDVYRKSL